MISYIRSEIYRLLHVKGSYLFILVCSVLLVSANIMLAVMGHLEGNSPYNNTGFSISLLYSYLPLVFLLCISVASIVFGNEHSQHTMKNSISYGISRGSIYFGKFISEVIYSFVALGVIAGLYIGSAYLLLENNHSGDLEVLLRAYFVALPLFLAALAITNCFLFIIESTGGAITAIIAFIMAYPMVNNFLAMKFKPFHRLGGTLPWNLINNIKFHYEEYRLLLPWEGNKGYLNYWLYGMFWMVLFLLIGYLVFRKKEIK